MLIRNGQRKRGLLWIRSSFYCGGILAAEKKKKNDSSKSAASQLGAEAVLISQDVFRREIFHVKDTPNNHAVGLMMEALLYARGKVPFIIVEGILPVKNTRTSCSFY